MENTNFRKLVERVRGNANIHQAFIQMEQVYFIKLYKINEISIDQVVQLYLNMQKKLINFYSRFYIARKKQNQEYWYQNQLRIFVWLLCAYLILENKPIQQCEQADWNYFSHIFNFKSLIFFQFQALSLVKSPSRPPAWTTQQSNLLISIIHQAKYKNRWNLIARQHYVRSSRQFFRTPKQCRERWMNHLDPSKVRTQWTPTQDLVLLNTIRKRGKRWSIAVKQLDDTRTEHMVKNRYKSLIANEVKKYPQKNESQIESLLIKRLNKYTNRLMKKDGVKIFTEQKEQDSLKLDEKRDEISYKQQQLKEMISQVKVQDGRVIDVQIQSQEQEIKYEMGEDGINKNILSLQNLSMGLLEHEIDIQHRIYGFDSQNESFLRF